MLPVDIYVLIFGIFTLIYADSSDIKYTIKSSRFILCATSFIMILGFIALNFYEGNYDILNIFYCGVEIAILFEMLTNATL